MLRVTNPYDDETVCELPHDEGRGLEEKVELARETFSHWRRLPLGERVAHVCDGLERFRAAGEEIARDVTRQMGKPIREARREVETVFERADYMISIARTTLAPDVLPEKDGLTRRIEHEPLGVVLNIAAWNYPLIIPVNVVVPALLAGNTVLLKHSGRTPLCGVAFEKAFGSLDGAGLVTNLILTHEETARLIGDSRLAHVAFTGSVEGGRQIYRQVSQRFIDVGLELGGKDPAYIAEDADIEFAAENVVDGACYNAGQSCCAVERVYVHRRRHDEFIDRALKVLQGYQLGDPLEETTTMGPLARRSALDTLERQVEEARGRGARLLAGGKRLARSQGNFFPPTLVRDVPNESLLMQEESFGPVVPVLSVESDEEALAHMAATEYGLTASVWTADPGRAERFGRELEAGTVFQNRCDSLDPALPWSGWGASGKGSTLSRYGFFHLTRRKSIHFRRRPR